MKRTLPLLFAVVATALLGAGKAHQKSALDEFNPPGTVRVAEKMWFDATEVTNMDWLEYLHWLEKTHGKDAAIYQNARPDSLVWRALIKYGEPNVELYLRHPAYGSHPVVGVSYKQAVAYCYWRTDRVQEMMELRQQDKLEFYIPEKWSYRLPTEQEWENMANLGYSEKGKKTLAKKKNRDIFPYYMLDDNNTYRTSEENRTYNDNLYPLGVFSGYVPNEKGMYHLFGNVAEMVAEPGISKGGSYIHQKKNIDAKSQVEYDGPQYWLGFRCVVEVIEE